MNRSHAGPIFSLITGLLLAACGGGGGGGGSAATTTDDGGTTTISNDSSGTSGGTAVASKGTIDGFGSISVNGVEFDMGQSEIYLNGMPSTDENLKLGMVVTIDGTVSNDGITGTAAEVLYDADVEGPIESIAAGSDGDSLSIIIFGVEVLVERVGTVIESVSFDRLAVGDFVEISGFIDEQLRVRATRVAKKAGSRTRSGAVKNSGYVDNLTHTGFILGDTPVDYSNADLSGLPGGAISSGQWVGVQGFLDNELITAERISMEVGSHLSGMVDEGEAVSVMGTVFCRTACDSRFTVDEFDVDASNAEITLPDITLREGLMVQVDGVWDGHEIDASRIWPRRGPVRIEAQAGAREQSRSALVYLQLFGGVTAAYVYEHTLMKDSTGRADPFKRNDIASGDFLRVEVLGHGYIRPASRIERIEESDDLLQAPVDRFNPGLDITLLGLTYPTGGAIFKDKQNTVISADEFYSELAVGDLVRVVDKRPTDGIADEVSFERDS